LISAPEFEGQPNFDARDLALAPLRAGERFNLIFVNLDPGARSLAQSLGELASQAEQFQFEGMKRFERPTYNMKMQLEDLRR